MLPPVYVNAKNYQESIINSAHWKVATSTCCSKQHRALYCRMGPISFHCLLFKKKTNTCVFSKHFRHRHIQWQRHYVLRLKGKDQSITTWMLTITKIIKMMAIMGLLPYTYDCGLRMHRECQKRFRRYCGLVIPTCITARARCMPGSPTSGFLWSRWRGNCSRYPGRLRNPQFVARDHGVVIQPLVTDNSFSLSIHQLVRI